MANNVDKGTILSILDIIIISTLKFLNKDGTSKNRKNYFLFIIYGEIVGRLYPENFLEGTTIMYLELTIVLKIISILTSENV